MEKTHFLSKTCEKNGAHFSRPPGDNFPPCGRSPPSGRGKGAKRARRCIIMPVLVRIRFGYRACARLNELKTRDQRRRAARRSRGVGGDVGAFPVALARMKRKRARTRAKTVSFDRGNSNCTISPRSAPRDFPAGHTKNPTWRKTSKTLRIPRKLRKRSERK